VVVRCIVVHFARRIRLACSIGLIVHLQQLLAFFLPFHSVTDVKRKPWFRPFRTGDQGNATSSVCGVHKMVCNGQWKQGATSSVVVLQHELVPLVSAGSKRKGRRSVCGVSSEDALGLNETYLSAAYRLEHFSIFHASAFGHFLPDYPHRTSLSHLNVHLPPPWSRSSQPFVESPKSAVAHLATCESYHALDNSIACLCPPAHSRRLQDSKDGLVIDSVRHPVGVCITASMTYHCNFLIWTGIAEHSGRLPRNTMHDCSSWRPDRSHR
jgi:hypothetical protein